jgi:hypothetical protein
METERGTTQEFNRFPFVRDLHEIQPVFPEADFGLGITSGLPVSLPELAAGAMTTSHKPTCRYLYRSAVRSEGSAWGEKRCRGRNREGSRHPATSVCAPASVAVIPSTAKPATPIITLHTDLFMLPPLTLQRLLINLIPQHLLMNRNRWIQKRQSFSRPRS